VTTAHKVARALRAGVVYVNCYDADDITVPFGGFKQSGIGRDKSLHAFDKYTELKTTWIDPLGVSFAGARWLAAHQPSYSGQRTVT
jgi:acyl-CoA reductase-like NAD-dependent aldehyde dehydrogenase